MKFIVATTNDGKAREFESLLAHVLPDDIELYTSKTWPEQLPEIEEDGDSFFANAFKKAWEISQITGCTTLADDSGLCVSGLDNAPGIYSARFAGEDATDADNNALLIERLKGMEGEQRRAHYALALCLVIVESDWVKEPEVEIAALPFEEEIFYRYKDRIVVWVEATTSGFISKAPKGDGGFGYDPYFFIPKFDMTMAELPAETKNKISHRGRGTERLAFLLNLFKA